MVKLRGAPPTASIFDGPPRRRGRPPKPSLVAQREARKAASAMKKAEPPPEPLDEWAIEAPPDEVGPEVPPVASQAAHDQLEALRDERAKRVGTKAPPATPQAQADILAQIEADLILALEHREQNKGLFFTPYAKQREFFDAGTWARERLFMAGNQLGKTYSGAFEAYCHLTGDYPDDWMGRRWDRPTRGWACGESSTLVRDVQQKLLMGEPGVAAALGTGMIPRSAIIDTSLARGVTDAYDTVMIRHKTNGVEDGMSVLKFKSYEQGRKKFQGDTIDWAWCDEEPDEGVYAEILTRITATKGMMFTTFTPLLGMSEVVSKFLNEKSPDRAVTVMTIYDAEHISPEERDKIIAGYPKTQREARAMGVPMMGEGGVFADVDPKMVEEEPLTDIPDHWCKVWGIDFGIGHPFAAVLLLWDRDTDTLHVHAAIRMADGLPLQHAVPMRQIGSQVPVSWPHDGTHREKGTGKQIADYYKDEDLRLLPEHAQWEEGGLSVEAGITEMTTRMTTNRFKVSRLLREWWEEFRLYHRKKGLIVKLKDDLMDATRTGLMMLRYAKPVPLGNGRWRGAVRPKGGLRAANLDFDLA